MKLTLLSLLLIPVFPYTGNSQITITDADFPAAGDVITVSRTADLTIDYSSTGPDYQWDFSNLTFADQVTRTHNPLSGVPFLINLSYGPTAVTAYRSSYYLPFTDLPLNQFGNLLPVQIEDVFQYTKKNTQKMTLVGYSASINGQDIPIKSDTIETKYIYPLEFEDEYISRGYTHLDMSVFIPAEWMQQRKRTTVVDGWGAITTPFGTFDVLRVQHKIEETDSVKYNGMAFGLNIPVTYEYEWIANDEKTPILKVVTTEVMGNETVVSAEYKDHNYLSVETIGEANALKVYPNPVSDELIISWSSGMKQIAIYYLDGTLVQQLSFEHAVQTVNTSALHPGMYFLSAQKDGETVTTSFVKK